MKNPRLLLLSLFVAGLAIVPSRGLRAQTAMFNESVYLDDNEKYDVDFEEEPLKSLEDEVCKTYDQRLEQSALIRTIASGEEGELDNVDAHCAMFSLCLGKYTGYSLSKTEHQLIQSKAFRDYLVNMGCDMVHSLNNIFPACFKRNLLKFLNEYIALLDRMAQHHYQKVVDPEYPDYYDITKDGKEEDWSWVGSNAIEGCFARRLVYDHVTLAEMKTGLLRVKTAVTGLSTEGKDEYVKKYTINNEISLCLSTSGPILIFPNGTKVAEPELIVCLKEGGVNSYKVTTWDYDNWESVQTLYSKSGTVLFKKSGED